MYLIFSHGIPVMIHGIFDSKEKANEYLNQLTSDNKDNYRFFSIKKLKLNKLYKNGVS